jgi:hypothetical protein
MKPATAGEIVNVNTFLSPITSIRVCGSNRDNLIRSPLDMSIGPRYSPEFCPDASRICTPGRVT